MHKLYTKLLIFLLASTFTLASEMPYFDKMDASTRHSLSQVLGLKKDASNRSIQATAKPGFPLVRISDRNYVDVFIRLSNDKDIDELISLGCVIKAKVNNIVALLIPVEKFESVIRMNSVLKVQASKLVKMSLDKSRKEINADKVHIGQGLPVNYKGDGVVVGVFDTGIDFTHPDFSNNLGTRIKFLWDMADTTKNHNPQGYDWGREYTKADIDQSPASVLERDGDGGSGHGTHVTGTAAGGGMWNFDMTGIAPQADIIFVKGLRTPDSEGSFASSDIIAGCQYIFKKAAELGRPAVINLSLGSPLGSHDGTAIDEEALSALTGEGKIIVAAAGNNGDYPIHAGDVVKPNESMEILISPINICDIFPEFCPNVPNIFMTAADIWYDTGVIDTLSIGVYTIDGLGLKLLGEYPMAVGKAIQDYEFRTNDTIFGYLSIDAIDTQNPGNNDGNAMIIISNGGRTDVPVDQYLWSIRTIGSKGGRIDLWAGVPVPEGIQITGMRGRLLRGNNAMTIGNYASAKKIVSVGSYITKNHWKDMDSNDIDQTLTIGSISNFSSIGPTRDGRLCPVVSAPGQVIFAPLSSHLTEGVGYFRDMVIPSGGYQGMSGTSMASPHVTGTIALMLQANPKLKYEDIVSIFSKTSRKDSFTGNVPNDTYGYGKLDAYAAVKDSPTDITPEQPKSGDISFYPQPANNYLLIERSLSGSVNSVNVYDFLGREITTPGINIVSDGLISLNIENLAPGVYTLRLNYQNNFIVKSFIKE